MTNAAPRIAGIELGGTKGIALIAEGNRILDRRTYPTRDPETTLKALTSALLEWHAERPVNAVGIASFGPVNLDPGSSHFGHILTTPKPGWSGADILGSVQGRSEEHTSELQSLMRISYAVFCLKKKKDRTNGTIICTKDAIQHANYRHYAYQ